MLFLGELVVLGLSDEKGTVGRRGRRYHPNKTFFSSPQLSWLGGRELKKAECTVGGRAEDWCHTLSQPFRDGEDKPSDGFRFGSQFSLGASFFLMRGSYAS